MNADKLTGLSNKGVGYGPISQSCINCLETLNNEMNYILFKNEKRFGLTDGTSISRELNKSN